MVFCPIGRSSNILATLDSELRLLAATGPVSASMTADMQNITLIRSRSAGSKSPSSEVTATDTFRVPSISKEYLTPVVSPSLNTVYLLIRLSSDACYQFAIIRRSCAKIQVGASATSALHLLMCTNNLWGLFTPSHSLSRHHQSTRQSQDKSLNKSGWLRPPKTHTVHPFR